MKSIHYQQVFIRTKPNTRLLDPLTESPSSVSISNFAAAFFSKKSFSVPGVTYKRLRKSSIAFSMDSNVGEVSMEC